MIDVTAIATGYYGGVLRSEGDKFTISGKNEFSELWMKMDNKEQKAVKSKEVKETKEVKKLSLGSAL